MVRRFSVVVAACTLLLVIAGSLVTSNDAAMSIPDWPLAYGKLVPPLEGGIRFEFAHRVLAATVAALTLALAVSARRPLAWFAFAAVVAQALLGGATVKLVDPKSLAIAHACLAQLCFGLLVAQALVGRTPWSAAGPPAGPAWMAAAALFAQTILGAALRHNTIGLIPHIAGAVAGTLIVMWAGLRVLSGPMEEPPLRRAAMLLLSFTFSQVFLGMGAYMARAVNADAPQPLPMMIWFTVAHVAVGSLAFGAAVAMAVIAHRDPAARTHMHHAGMVVA